MPETPGNFFWLAVVVFLILDIVFLAATLVVSNWLAKKLARRYFKKYWAELTKGRCETKSRHILYFEGCVALSLSLLVLVVSGYFTGFIGYLGFYTIFLPVWIIDSVLRASRDYIKERFPEECSGGS